MTVKKETEEKNEEPKISSKYDWESQLDSKEIPEHKKDGFRYYINKNEINIKNKSDLDKKLKEYDNKNAGE